MRRPLIDKDTPLPVTREELKLVVTEDKFQDYVKRGGGSKTMTDHYYDKLLHIGEMASGNEYLVKQSVVEYEYMVDWILKSNASFKVLREMYPLNF